MLDQKTLQRLKEHALVMRKDCVNMFHKWGHGHFGGSFSCVEIIALLYFQIMNVDPSNPGWPDRDRFILSKGHGAATYYSALSQKGFFPASWLEHYGDLCANLNTHPCMHRVRGLDLSTGSLGHGLPVGAGMALAAKLDEKSYRTFVLMGDGECGEGMIWETAMLAPLYKLDNLIAIVDRNRLCIAGDTECFLPLEPFASKWESCNWEVYEADGHDFDALSTAFEKALTNKNGMPKVIIADTVKGKGVSMMENDPKWHAHKIDDTMYAKIMDELTMN